MKKVLFLVLFAYGAKTAFGQNVPNGSGPLTPTVSTVTLPTSFSPPSAGYNLSRTFVPLRPLTSSSDAMFSLSPSTSSPGNYHCKVATSYTNGWGDVIQTIARGGISTNDVLTPYDLRPSLTKTGFLSYSLSRSSHFQTNCFSNQHSYYSTHAAAENGFNYAQTVISYPSGVPTTTSYSAGSSCVGNSNGTTVTFTVNSGSENIIKYPESLTSSTSYYAASDLSIKTTLTPNGGKLIEYFDKDNREVCKQVVGYAYSSTPNDLTTYYIYNDLGQITKVITPQGTYVHAASSSADISELTYSNEYNAYGSPTTQKVPGKSGSDYTVYDVKNRPVLVQTPLLQSLGKYKFNLYDSRDRVIISGLITDASTPSSWQSTLYSSSLTLSSGTLLYYLIMGVGSSYPTSITDCEIEEVNYYDEYPVSRSFVSCSTCLSTGFAYAVAPTPYMVTQGLPTFSLARVRDGGMGTSSDSWVCTLYFYDQKGHVIQTQSLNPAHAQTYATCMGGASSVDWDTHTMQYSFAGQKILDIVETYDLSTSDKPSTKIRNFYEPENTENGRPYRTEQTLDDGFPIRITEFNYDDLGRVSSRSQGGIEIQNYDYNIRGQLAAINRDYVSNPCTSGSTATFGCILNYDFGFSQRRYDGNISGIIWRGAELWTPMRAYGYEYEPSGKLKHAEFRQFCAPHTNSVPCGISSSAWTWNKDNVDFTVSNIYYDYNGNLLSMNQRGTNATGPLDMDKLHYAYEPRSNTLKGVSDEITVDYHLGDFTDVYTSCSESLPEGGSVSVPCPDYTYDPDGNLKSDVNKSVAEIVYNEMDQPISVTYGDGGVINNVYTGNGTLVSKAVIPFGATSYNSYRYCGPFTFLKNGTSPWKLQFALHDEGRARFNSTTGLFTYDYFVKDHLGNVRTVVTGNQTNGDPELTSGGGSSGMAYIATHEIAAGSSETAVFTNIDMVRDEKPLTTDTSDAECAHLNGGDTSRIIGTAILLKVMAGDQFNISAETYYDTDTTATVDSSSTVLSAILSTLTATQNNINIGENTGAQLISDAFNPENYALYQAIVDSVSDHSIPQAFIHYLVFDEHMNLLPDQCGAIQIGATAGEWQLIGTPEAITVSTSGYVSIFISDATTSDVHFDHVDIGLASGRLIQEQHYYPFGLTINEGESGTVVKNKFKYQGKELADELKLNLYDFTARQYDPQIGRFWGTDPMNQFPSGYTGMGNNPANMIDPSGCSSSTSSTVVGDPVVRAKYERVYGNTSNENVYIDEMMAMDKLSDWLDLCNKQKQDQNDAFVQGIATLIFTIGNIDYSNSIQTPQLTIMRPTWEFHGSPDGGCVNQGVNGLCLPAFNVLWGNYPMDNNDMPRHVVSDKLARNQCAIMLSYSFLQSNVDMTGSENILLSNTRYIAMARDFAKFLLTRYGPPVAGSTMSMDGKTPVMTWKDFDGKYPNNQKGIMFVENLRRRPGQQQVTGHIDLFNGYIENYRSFARRTYWQDYDVKIWFWPLK